MITETYNQVFDDIAIRGKLTLAVVLRVDGQGWAVIALTDTTSDDAFRQQIADAEQIYGTVNTL
ncbi:MULTISPECIES: hypothetical protein [unclassified Rhodococcus (in: high G+C Gram-positive bacteria)]|uniref:hypothetical protein n=1 Tax=unclassified Rhodococcus (in: high G+C Gram-positive bacteria) TaxID=192944 RepID=UPI0011422B95|nr:MULTISPECIES: hypothetical protein [unclassified Rhodococcus (in: high G+C Gram-positive bacteria)]RZL21018.1 MAG: hypothetical protein EOP31_29805 [Rhodococcus sp. (in: high G+C Gram-positive bacteria)]